MSIEALQIACATCARSFQEGGGNAAGWAVIFMLAVIIPVLGAIGVCMIRIVRREREALDPKYTDR